jgi:hypothetical protein
MSLYQQGITADAIREYEDIIRLAPDYPATLNDFAQVLSGGDAKSKERAVGYASQACELTHYRQTKFVITLSDAQLRAGRAKESAESFALASDLAMNYGQTSLLENLAVNLNNLAWFFATGPDGSQRNGAFAVQLAQRACELTHDKIPVMLGTLAAAYAEAGQFDEAVAAGQKACALAAELGQTDLLEQNKKLTALYQSHQPFHESPTR